MQSVDAEKERDSKKKAYPRNLTGDFLVGCDLGKRVDPTAIAVVKASDSILKVVHLKKFPLETPFATVIGYLKILGIRLRYVMKTLIDQTGIGDFVLEEARNVGVANVDGMVFTPTVKEEMMNYLKSQMEQNKLRIPYDPDLIAELNVEKFELTKEGRIRFYHEDGTHDDQLWALALAVYASRLGGGGFSAMPRRR